jgi:ANTAR domain/GAF domain
MGAVEPDRLVNDERARGDRDRDAEADRREAEADQRERHSDARELVLDRWERDIAARAAALNLLDDVEEEGREQARLRRAGEHVRRRDDAEARRDTAIERDIRQTQRTDRDDVAGPSPGSIDTAVPVARLATALLANLPLDEVLELILAAGVEALPGCGAASVALINEGRLQTAASTASWAADLDRAQVELDCGPLPSATGDAMVFTTDMTHDDRWPRLAGLPATNIPRSVISIGLVVGGTLTGVLTLYADVGSPFGQQALRIADMLAAHAAATLERTIDRLTYQAQTEAWQHALASRDVIGQAKGILMEQRSTTADEAYHLLRKTSQRLNVKLRVIAEHVVDQRLLPDA